MLKRIMFLLIASLLVLVIGATSSSAQGTFPSIVRINFEEPITITPAGFLSDVGSAYGNRGNGFTYGWVAPNTTTPADLTGSARERNISGLDVERDTLIHLQLNAGPPGWWEIAVPDGDYRVTVSVGDRRDSANGYDSIHNIQAEGAPVIVNFVGCCMSFATEYRQASVVTEVTDGRLTISDTGGTNTKINSIYIQPVSDVDGDGILDLPVTSVPNEGTIRINASSPTPLYVLPGNQIATDSNNNPIILPGDNIGQGFDTYIITDIRAFEGEVWVAIFLGSASYGWVPLSAVEQVTEITGLAAAIASAGGQAQVTEDPGTPSTPLDADGYAIVNTSRLNMRSGDSSQFSIVTILRGGTELFVLGRNSASTWWLVSDGTNEGWVNAEFIVLRGDLTETTVEESDGDILPPTFYTFGNTMTYVTTSTLRSNRLCEVPGDAEYVVLGRNRDGAWFQIEATCNGQAIIGWVEASQGALRNGTFASVPVR